jgi:hypothetical protein
LRDQLLQQFDRALAIDLPEFRVAFPGLNDGAKPSKARLRQEIKATALQKRDGGEQSLIIFFSYAHAREGKGSKSASFARVAISLITLTH